MSDPLPADVRDTLKWIADPSPTRAVADRIAAAQRILAKYPKSAPANDIDPEPPDA